MTDIDPATPAQRAVPRRTFLTTVGLSGAALAGGLVVGGGPAGAAARRALARRTGPRTVAGGGGAIGLSLNGLVDYTKGVASGCYQALAGSDYELIVLQANFDAATETSNLESLLAQGVAGLVIQPNTADGAAAGAEAAATAGVPASNCLWPGPSNTDEFYVGVAALDSVEGGRMIGEWLKANVPAGGKVCIVQGVVGQGFSERIDEGLDEALEGSPFEIVTRKQGFFDRATAVTVVETALQVDPDITIVVDYAATMSNGISQLLSDLGRDDIVHVTSDADAEMMEWIKTPYLQATRYYSSAETGLIATQAVLAALAGDEVEFETPVTQVMATADDIDDIVAENPFFYDEFTALVDEI